MDYKSALEILKTAIPNLRAENYDGVIVKKLEASNTLDEERSSNQTHIAISGQQMDIFPYIMANGYFNCDYIDKDEELKKYFVLQIPFHIFLENINYLDDNNNTVKLSDDNNYIKVDVSVLRSRRKKGADQVQLSIIALDSKEFVDFRKKLHTGDYIIILKRYKSLEYDCLGIKSKDAKILSELNNKFYKIETYTTVKIEDYVEKKYVNKEKARNLLLYGVPGSGKSFKIEKEINGSDYVRVVFHPDYTYSDFVGQIMPKIEKIGNENKLTYKFVPGPFTKALKLAIENPDEMHYLIIEEINRGNASAIFGDIFQLLDRNSDGSGKYAVTNFDIGREIYGDENTEIRIPQNLSILATMNTSDQNVFTLDTAFQRRWNLEYMENNINEANHADLNIEGSNVTWAEFANTINDEILEYNDELSASEDKQLGAYFVNENELGSKIFPEKALKYLWDDAFKLDRDRVFSDGVKSIGDLFKVYKASIEKNQDPIKAVIRLDVYNRMLRNNKIESSDKKIIN